MSDDVGVYIPNYLLFVYTETTTVLPSRGEYGNKANTTYSLMYSEVYGVPPELFLSLIV